MDRLEQRVDRIERKLDGFIERVDSKLDGFIARVDSRLDYLVDLQSPPPRPRRPKKR
jgi:hypothetical protein